MTRYFTMLEIGEIINDITVVSTQLAESCQFTFDSELDFGELQTVTQTDAKKRITTQYPQVLMLMFMNSFYLGANLVT